jgi:catechol 2,3-dioxygenase-like lactoylglutathione lyase family enzyme
MIMSVHHASITTGNLANLKRFYSELLGFKEIFETDIENSPMTDAIQGLSGAKLKICMLRLGSVCLELFEFKHPTGKRNDPARPVCDSGYSHICLCVSDIASEYERLRAAGMHFHCPPQHMPGFCSATYGRDPDGNIIELIQPEAGSPFDLSH